MVPLAYNVSGGVRNCMFCLCVILLSVVWTVVPVVILFVIVSSGMFDVVSVCWAPLVSILVIVVRNVV